MNKFITSEILLKQIDEVALKANHPRDIPLGIVDVIFKYGADAGEFIHDASDIDEMYCDDEENNQPWLLDLKVMMVLKLTGCTDMLKRYAEQVAINSYLQVMNCTENALYIERMKSEYMRSVASVPRNQYYAEIMEIIKLTWDKHPNGSKKRMISLISEAYKNKVDESSLKRWIKKSGLTPPKPTKYLPFSLVVPNR